MKRASGVLGVVMVVSLSVGVALGLSDASSAEISLRYAGDLPIGNHLTRGQEFFAQRVSEISKGQVKVLVFPAGQLFAAKDYVKVLPAGAVDMAQVLVPQWSGLVPTANFTELPLFWDGWSHAWKMYDSEVGEILRGGMEKVGARVLFWLQDGKAGFTTKFPLKDAGGF